jgi:FixJ family two-component response regulator
VGRSPDQSIGARELTESVIVPTSSVIVFVAPAALPFYIVLTEQNSNLIAIVDDDHSVQDAVRDLLESDGRAVRCFDTAEAFLSSGLERKLACLVLDLRMPGMSGTELHRRLLDQGCQVPVIFMTAHGADQEARRRALAGGAVAYLIKPFDQDEFLDAVHKALRLEPMQDG